MWSDENLNQLENEIGPIEKVMRPEVENPVEIISLAKKSVVALLIVGDPLQATTHTDLLLQAEEAGVDYQVIHGLSITGLVTGAVGLSNYKFGRQTTLTYPYGGWVATSPLEVIAMNRIQSMHTLVLLDLDPTGEGVGGQRPMQPKDALDSILLMHKKLQDNLDNFEASNSLDSLRIEAYRTVCDQINSFNVVLCTDMGTPKQSINYMPLHSLAEANTGGLHCLVVPGDLSDVEQKALARWTKE